MQNKRERQQYQKNGVHGIKLILFLFRRKEDKVAGKSGTVAGKELQGKASEQKG